MSNMTHKGTVEYSFKIEYMANYITPFFLKHSRNNIKFCIK